jgi:hypothetical protein
MDVEFSFLECNTMCYIEVNRCFGGIDTFNLQDLKISQGKRQYGAGSTRFLNCVS